jgi:hypothetical protein
MQLFSTHPTVACWKHLAGFGVKHYNLFLFQLPAMLIAQRNSVFARYGILAQREHPVRSQIKIPGEKMRFNPIKVVVIPVR